MKLNIIGICPIPVGHQVEVMWYKELKNSLFGSATEEEIPMPLVVDLNTGIHYADRRLYTDKVSVFPLKINIPEHRLRPGLIQYKKITGAVTYCSIVQIDDLHFETELSIE